LSHGKKNTETNSKRIEKVASVEDANWNNERRTDGLQGVELEKCRSMHKCDAWLFISGRFEVKLLSLSIYTSFV
jgi:hypothetical protein